MSKFVDALEACVREAAARVAATSHVWHDHCVSPGEKTRVQVEQLAPLMDEMRVEWGYPGALWCAFWSAVSATTGHSQASSGAPRHKLRQVPEL